MTRRPSILSQVLAQGADALADRWQVPAETRPAFRATFDSVMREAFKLRAGERIPSWGFFVAKESTEQRLQQRRRILEALDQGQSPAAIAIKEGVTPQWVRVLRAKRAKAQQQRNG
jgi:hypothetical protein